jgi:protein-serine/threonine kinase
MGGGDLLNLLIERDVFEEGFTRFYIAEVLSMLTLPTSN